MREDWKLDTLAKEPGRRFYPHAGEKGKVAVVAGLGLIGASMAKALKAYSAFQVYGWNRTESVARQALSDGAIDGIADDEVLARADLVIPVLYPKATAAYLRRIIPKLKPGAMIVDLVGIKGWLVREIEPLALSAGVRYVGGHPMAGLARAGYERSFPELFQGASMILVPTAASSRADVLWLRRLFLRLGFGAVKLCSAARHDRMIAHTSQLAHVVSNSYVKSPVSADYAGFSGGSYKDMTRIACLNERVWSELFLLNREALLEEMDALLAHIGEVRQALYEQDGLALEEILRQGRLAKERIDRANPNLPSD